MSCQKCGECCKNFRLTIVGAGNKQIGFIQTNTPGFIRDIYDELNIWAMLKSLKEVSHELPLDKKWELGIVFDCPFLTEDNLCSKYEDRYDQCRIYNCDKCGEQEG